MHTSLVHTSLWVCANTYKNVEQRSAVPILAVRHLKSTKLFGLARRYIGGFWGRRQLWLRCFFVLFSAYSLDLRIILIVSGCLFLNWLLDRLAAAQAAQKSRVWLQEPQVWLAFPPRCRLRRRKEAIPSEYNRGRRCVINRS